MNFYDDLVMQTQMNYSKYYHIYASGSTPYQLTDKKPLPYSEQINRLIQEVKEADCVVVGGASGLSAAGGGDFYYEDNDSYRKYFHNTDAKQKATRYSLVLHQLLCADNSHTKAYLHNF